MANDHKIKSEDELLADAIPIDLSEEDEAPAGESELEPIEIDAPDVQGGEDAAPTRTIQTFGPESRHEDKWSRTPNSPGTGAIHVKTFVTKLRLDAIDHMDQQVNEWLDAHPQYEVKFVTSTVGKLVGKNTEDAIFMSVWV